MLTLVERKTRLEIMLKIDQQDQANVDQAMNHLYKQLGDQAENIFKTITSDNGSEFAGIMNRSSIQQMSSLHILIHRMNVGQRKININSFVDLFKKANV